MGNTNMHKAFYELFEPIQADEDLKQRTKAFLDQKSQEAPIQKPFRNLTSPWILKTGLATLGILLSIGWMYWLFFIPTAQIHLMDSSFELGINRLNHVIYICNWEDKTTIKTYQPYWQTLDQILDPTNESEDTFIAISASTSEQSDQIQTYIEQNHGETHCYITSLEETEMAHHQGLAYGKYQMFLALQALDPSITLEMVQNQSMKELRTLKTMVEIQLSLEKNEDLTVEAPNEHCASAETSHDLSFQGEESHHGQQKRMGHGNHE